MGGKSSKQKSKKLKSEDGAEDQTPEQNGGQASTPAPADTTNKKKEAEGKPDTGKITASGEKKSPGKTPGSATKTKEAAADAGDKITLLTSAAGDVSHAEEAAAPESNTSEANVVSDKKDNNVEAEKEDEDTTTKEKVPVDSKEESHSTADVKETSQEGSQAEAVEVSDVAQTAVATEARAVEVSDVAQTAAATEAEVAVAETEAVKVEQVPVIQLEDNTQLEEAEAKSEAPKVESPEEETGESVQEEQVLEPVTVQDAAGQEESQESEKTEEAQEEQKTEQEVVSHQEEPGSQVEQTTTDEVQVTAASVEDQQQPELSDDLPPPPDAESAEAADDDKGSSGATPDQSQEVEGDSAPAAPSDTSETGAATGAASGADAAAHSQADEPVLVPTDFTWEDGGETVLVTGSFNSWQDKIALTKSGEVFNTTIDLPVGEYLYRFLVDDKWLINKNQPVKCDESGQESNILLVTAAS